MPQSPGYALMIQSVPVNVNEKKVAIWWENAYNQYNRTGF